MYEFPVLHFVGLLNFNWNSPPLESLPPIILTNQG